MIYPYNLIKSRIFQHNFDLSSKNEKKRQNILSLFCYINTFLTYSLMYLHYQIDALYNLLNQILYLLLLFVHSDQVLKSHLLKYFIKVLNHNLPYKKLMVALAYLLKLNSKVFITLLYFINLSNFFQTKHRVCRHLKWHCEGCQKGCKANCSALAGPNPWPLPQSQPQPSKCELMMDI